jgi:hypothetical protein
VNPDDARTRLNAELADIEEQAARRADESVADPTR